MPCGKRTEVDLFKGMGIQLRNNEVCGITALALFDAHCGRERVPHAVLPLQIVFFHALVVVTLATFADAGRTHLGEGSIDAAADNVVVLVGLVAQTEDNVLEAIEVSTTVGEFERVVFKVLHQLHCIIGGFAFSVGGHDKDSSAVFGELVEVLEIVLFGIADEGGETELLFGLLCETDGVLFCRSCLRAVEDYNPLFL